MTSQAIVLVGGEGTRLRPLTSRRPKPIVPLVDRPFMAYMLEWLAGHGVDDVIMACGFLADQLRDELGDGSRFGVRLEFAEEPEPRGTGGALRFAADRLGDRLQDRFLMLNGDVLTDVDLAAQLAEHDRTGASATLGLVPVEDPSAYGLVLRGTGGVVDGFLEKPGPDQLVGLGVRDFVVSAGIYVLERSVLDLVAPGRKVSIETEVWPRLVGAGLHATVDRDAYWMDIGTPERYLQATGDILAGRVRTAVRARLAGGPVDPEAEVAPTADVDACALVDAGAVIGARAHVGHGSVVGPGARVGEGAVLERSVVLSGAEVGAGARLRDAVVSPGATVGDGARLEGLAMVGDDGSVEAGVVLGAGATVAPGERAAAGSAGD